MKNVVLNNGVEMPVLGFGVYLITDAEECERSVYEAMRTGYHQIETHPFNQQIETQIQCASTFCSRQTLRRARAR